MVRVRGFEPPTSAFQVRSSGLSELHPVELAFPTGIEPACLPVRSRALVQLSYGKNWYDVWDSNPCCCAENADAWPLAERRMIGSGRRIRTCRILINSQAHPPRTVDRNELVDRLGVEPSASCLQGISPPRRPARGASRSISNEPLRVFSAAQSPDLLTRRIGADGGNRNLVF